MLNRNIPTIVLFVIILAFSKTLFGQTTIVRFETNFGNIDMALDGAAAPNTVANLLDYIQDDFYDDTIFHRVVNEPNPFVIQAGAYDPNLYILGTDPNFTSDPLWTRDPNVFNEPNDPINSEAGNGLSNIRGTVAMALQGCDENSATSQFYINLDDNSSLDNFSATGCPGKGTSDPRFTVFGEVVDGLESVVDEIAMVNVVSLGDPNGTQLDDVPEPNTPVIINDALFTPFAFGSNSGDFSNVDFIRASAGDRRIFIGQNQFAGNRFTHTFSSRSFTGDLSGLRWQQTGVPDLGIDSFDITLTKDSEGDIWVLEYEKNSQVLVSKNNIFDAQPLSNFTSDNFFFKLIDDDFTLDPNDPNTFNDPNNIINFDIGGDAFQSELTSVTEVFPGFLDLDPNLDGQAHLVSTVEVPNQTNMADWAWYHPTLGLALEVFNTSTDPNNIDTLANGWRLFNDPNQLIKLEITIKASKDRTNPQDRLNLTGDFPLTKDETTGETISIFIGPHQFAMEFDSFTTNKKMTIYSFQGTTSDGGTVTMRIDFNKGTFRYNARDINLTGLDPTVVVDMSIGTFIASGTALNNKSFPLTLQANQEDILRVERFSYVSDDRPTSFTNRNLTVRGSITTDMADVDLTGVAMTINWGSRTLNVTDDPNNPLFERRGDTNRFIFRDRSNPLRRVSIDFDKAEFEVMIRRTNLNAPPQDFSIQFNKDPNSPFDETVTDIGISALPKLSD